MKRREFLGTVAAGMAVVAVPVVGGEPDDLKSIEDRIRGIACELPMNVRRGYPSAKNWSDFEAAIRGSLEFHFPQQFRDKTAQGGIAEMWGGKLGAHISLADRPRPVAYEIRWELRGDKPTEPTVWRYDAIHDHEPGSFRQIEYHFVRSIA